jgi:signal transduction histidine kinase
VIQVLELAAVRREVLVGRKMLLGNTRVVGLLRHTHQGSKRWTTFRSLKIFAKRSMHIPMERSELYLAAVGQLAGGLAHELNNILAVILSSTELALEASGNNTEVANELAEVAEATLRAAQLTRALLAFGGKELRSPRCVALDEMIASLAPMRPPQS